MAHRPTCAGATYNAQKKRSMQPRWAATAIVAGGKPQLARIAALRRQIEPPKICCFSIYAANSYSIAIAQTSGWGAGIVFDPGAPAISGCESNRASFHDLIYGGP